MRLLAFTCGWLTGPARLFVAGASGRLRVPVPSFLIDHARGLALFDTGLHPDVQRDPAGRLGANAPFFTPDFTAGQDVASHLRAAGIDPAAVRFVVTSHLHFDHAGGNATIPNAALIVQRREWDAGHDPDLIARNFYDPKDYDLGHGVLMVDGEHDLFRDGRVVCTPTWGHTPGHQSLRVRLDGGREVLLAADACYLRRTLEALELPEVVFDRKAMLDVLHRLRALRAAGVEIVYGHDPEHWATIPQAPAAFT